MSRSATAGALRVLSWRSEAQPISKRQIVDGGLRYHLNHRRGPNYGDNSPCAFAYPEVLIQRQDVMATLRCGPHSDMQLRTWSTSTIAVLSNFLSYCEY